MKYGLTFDLNISVLKQTYPNKSYQNAYNDIRRFLAKLGFRNKQGSVYLVSGLTADDCHQAVSQLNQAFAWFKASLRDVTVFLVL